MTPNSVTLIAENDEWIVTIVEDGQELFRSFKVQSHAQSWSDGHCFRLGLPLAAVPQFHPLADD